MKARAIFFAFLLALSLQTFGQMIQDAQLWKGLILEKSFLDERVKVSLNEEFRLVNNFSTVGNAYTDLIGEFKFTKGLSLGAGYRYSVRQDVNVHRLYSDFNWQPRIEGRLKLSFRTRFQYDWNHVKTRTMIRPRLGLSYNIKDTKLEPFVSAEPFFEIDQSPSWATYRLMAGFRYPLRKNLDLRVAYVWDQEVDDRPYSLDHALTIRIVVDLDKGSEKEKKKE